MMKDQEGAADGAPQRAYIEGILEQYPHISKDQLEELLHWFNKEASALDIGLVASNEAIRRGYRLFRAEHIDRFKPRDLGYAALFVAICGGVIGLIGYWAI